MTKVTLGDLLKRVRREMPDRSFVLMVKHPSRTSHPYGFIVRSSSGHVRLAKKRGTSGELYFLEVPTCMTDMLVMSISWQLQEGLPVVCVSVKLRQKRTRLV